MTTAYSGQPGDGRQGLDRPDIACYLPFETVLNDGTRVAVGPFRQGADDDQDNGCSDWECGQILMNHIIQEGKSWPFTEPFATMDAYRGYFLSHAAICVRLVAETDQQQQQQQLIGCFYIKPNYPGRCSHICNGGFITHPDFRRRGVASLMGRTFLRVAADLGYLSAYFNLVFASNKASVALWESLGFQRVAVLERAAKLKGVEGLDTAYGYRYDLEKLPAEYFWDVLTAAGKKRLKNSLDL